MCLVILVHQKQLLGGSSLSYVLLFLWIIIIIFYVLGVDIEIPEEQLNEIADSMAEWEGPIADKLKLRKTDVEEIKTKYPQKLMLQK